MNVPSDLSMQTNDALCVESEAFKCEHHGLDGAITALTDEGTGAALAPQRLEKREQLPDPVGGCALSKRGPVHG